MMSLRLSVAAIAVFAASLANAAEQNVFGANPLIGGNALLLQSLGAKAAETPSASASALVPRGGYVVVNMSGFIRSSVPPAASRKLFCYLNIAASGSASFQNRTGGVAAVITGSKFTCSLKLVYKWQVTATDQLVAVGYVSGVDTSLSPSEVLQGALNGAGVTVPLPSNPFPANAATTTLSATDVFF